MQKTRYKNCIYLHLVCLVTINRWFQEIESTFCLQVLNQTCYRMLMDRISHSIRYLLRMQMDVLRSLFSIRKRTPKSAISFPLAQFDFRVVRADILYHVGSGSSSCPVIKLAHCLNTQLNLPYPNKYVNNVEANKFSLPDFIVDFVGHFLKEMNVNECFFYPYSKYCDKPRNCYCF